MYTCGKCGSNKYKTERHIGAAVVCAECGAVISPEGFTVKKSQIGNWRHINTLPTEKRSKAILHCPSLNDGGKAVIGEAFLADNGLWYWAGSEPGYHDSIIDGNAAPTYWMPMPQPPLAP